MKPVKTVLLASAIQALIQTGFTLQSAFADGGGMGSRGGGLAYVCRDQKTHTITSATLLDAMEATQYYGCGDVIGMPDAALPFPEKLEAANELIEQRQKNISLTRPLALKANSDNRAYIEDSSHQDWGTPGTYLAATEDYGTKHVVRLTYGCDYEQVGNYENGVLHLNQEIVDHFTSTILAWFLNHESIYGLERVNLGATNSESSRALNAYLMAKNPDQCKFKKMPRFNDLGYEVTTDLWNIETKQPGFVAPKTAQYTCDLSPGLAALSDSNRVFTSKKENYFNFESIQITTTAGYLRQKPVLATDDVVDVDLMIVGIIENPQKLKKENIEKLKNSEWHKPIESTIDVGLTALKNIESLPDSSRIGFTVTSAFANDFSNRFLISTNIPPTQFFPSYKTPSEPSYFVEFNYEVESDSIALSTKDGKQLTCNRTR